MGTEMMKIRLFCFDFFWILDQYLPESMKCKFGKKTKKRRNEEMKNQEMQKCRKPELVFGNKTENTKKLRNRESKKPNNLLIYNERTLYFLGISNIIYNRIIH